MNKRKNDTVNKWRDVWFAVGMIALIIFSFLWAFLYQIIYVCGCSPSFNPTATAIVATNNAIAIQIEQTEAASTAMIETNQAVVTFISQTYAAEAT